MLHLEQMLDLNGHVCFTKLIQTTAQKLLVQFYPNFTRMIYTKSTIDKGREIKVLKAR